MNTNNLLLVTKENVLDWFCWSADVKSVPELCSYLEQMPRGLCIKIDRLGEKLMGEASFDAVINLGFKLFVDAKLAEIPTKIAALAEAYIARNPGIFMLNVMCESWSNDEFERTDKLKQEDLDAIKQFADICWGAGVRPCGVTVLTTTTEEVCQKKYGRGVIEQTLVFARILHGAGFRDMVCVVEAIPFVLAEFPDMNCWPAGIRPAGSDTHDQINARTPARALEVGAHRCVIGRPFTNGDVGSNITNITGELVREAKAARKAA